MKINKLLYCTKETKETAAIPVSLILLILLIMSQASCKKFVEVPPPVTQLVTASVFNNDYTATAAQLAVYVNMDGAGLVVDVVTGLSSDELRTYSTGQYSLDLYKNTLTANDGNSISLWRTCYSIIYQENAIIAGLEEHNGVSADVKKQLTGEAKFVRAFWYSYLVNLYGDVPLITTTNYQINSVASRTPQAQVYQQIISDLNDAKGLLSNNYVDATNVASTVERVRPTKWSAAALLARVYLFMGDYKNAEDNATTVINNTGLYSLCTSPNYVFLKNSTETIWQLMLNTSKYYTSEASNFILTGPPKNNAYSSSLSNQLLSSFETGDKRSSNWIDSITVTAGGQPQTYYYPYKYKAGTTATSQSEYSMILRLAEQYLIRAEAEAQPPLNDLPGAAADLNKIRNRAGLSNYSGPMDRTSLVNAIQHERQVELFTEWGDRWFNLKRTLTINAIMNTVTPLKGGATWQPFQALYPIPVTDIQADINLKQTPSY